MSAAKLEGRSDADVDLIGVGRRRSVRIERKRTEGLDRSIHGDLQVQNDLVTAAMLLHRQSEGSALVVICARRFVSVNCCVVWEKLTIKSCGGINTYAYSVGKNVMIIKLGCIIRGCMFPVSKLS